jgi:hypothetical protein
MRKPIASVTIDMFDTYEYIACKAGTYEFEAIGLDSLINLKREIKNRCWKSALIQSKKGMFSCGQDIVSELPYIPRYN